ncbi:MAG: hypothetical protein COX14_05620 [Chloroflexi bacterium CG23_combo_of_CG06-09_8_20_14_all_45_10]|nr:MAG: hypothetical protein COX14_05620 [Chloroflexi bacterium CG23_combo_of_CG06-09_8_20_14_all_45_10]
MVEEEIVSVIPEQLIRARESLGLEPREVAEALHLDEKKLNEWEEGISEPSVDNLWSLADLYNRSTDYFLRPLTALPEKLSFRLERRKAVRDLPQTVRRIIVRFEELCRGEYELEEALQEHRRILIERVDGDYSPEELATRERRRLGIGEEPIQDLRKLLIRQGARVFVLPIPEIPALELSGMSWWHDTYGPCILINGRNNRGRRSFTLAHEYGHLLRADPPTVCAFMLDIPEERFAHSFAAVFLMPAKSVRDSFIEIVGLHGVTISDRDLGRLSNRFRVSLEAMGRRLEELDLIPRGTTDSRIAEWEKKPTYYRGRKGPIWRHQLGEDFVSLALEAYASEHLSAGKLAQYFGLNLRDALQVARESEATSKK